MAERRFFKPGGRLGPGPAGEPAFVHRFLIPPRTRAGVSLFGSVGFSQGDMNDLAPGRARDTMAVTTGTRSLSPPDRGQRICHQDQSVDRRQRGSGGR